MKLSTERERLRWYLRDHKWWWKWPLIAATLLVWVGALALFVAPWQSDARTGDVAALTLTTEAPDADPPSEAPNTDSAQRTFPAGGNLGDLLASATLAPVDDGEVADAAAELVPPDSTTPPTSVEATVVESEPVVVESEPVVVESTRRPNRSRRPEPAPEPPPSPVAPVVVPATTPPTTVGWPFVPRPPATTPSAPTTTPPTTTPPTTTPPTTTPPTTTPPTTTPPTTQPPPDAADPLDVVGGLLPGF